MVGEILSAVISNLTEKASDFLLKEYTTELGVEEECQKLCRILPAVQAVVADAGERSRAEFAFRCWLHDLKAVAYEAEDVLDELRYDAISKDIQTEIRSEKKARLYLSLPGSSRIGDAVRSFSHGKRLKEVTEKIYAIVDEMNQFGFSIREVERPVAVVNRLRSHSHVIESTIIGRNDDLEKIVDIVLGQAEKESFAVLPIVGMGGLGKTTLTQLVYNSEKIQENFELKLWVCVSDKFDVARLVKSIIDAAIGKDSQLPVENMELICQKLREKLTRKRYLLVLDDVWNEIPGKWEQLKLLLYCGSPRSVVIVTTRSQKVASIVGSMSAYNLQGLNEGDLWGIFRQRAFGMSGDEQPAIVEIGKQLMRKCLGSPLVATILGGLMSYKKEEREWLDVLWSDIWDHMAIENEIMSVLKLSFENLPSYMKQCFVFCAVYPKNYEMDRDTLIQLWMANSYIPSQGNMEMEEKGKAIFNELAWRGFFHDIKKKKQKEGLFDGFISRTVCCRMHDLIHGLAQFLVGSECASLSNLDQPSDVLSNDTLHVSSCSTVAPLSLFKKCFSLRTILLLPPGFRTRKIRFSVDLSKANSSRVLSLRKAGLKEIHVEPRTMKHLRYLDLSWCLLKVLPESLCTLYSLQTLKLSGCYNLLYLPKGMRHMHSLRHVYLDGCDNLECMPAGLGKLSCLQTLTKYIVDPAIGCGIEELKDLNLRGRLELCDLAKICNQQEAKFSNLISKENLFHLKLLWTDSIFLDPDAARDILEGLEPSGGLKGLEIRKYGGIHFSSWMHNSRVLRNLTKLKLDGCRRCTTLPPIWQLPSLKVLYIHLLDSLKHICSGNPMLAQGDVQALHMFPKLQELYLFYLTSLESWQENNPAELTFLALPHLLNLEIDDCPKLDALPSCPLLSKLAITGRSSIPSSVIESFKNNGVSVSSDVSSNQVYLPVSTFMEYASDFDLPEPNTELGIQKDHEKLCRILPGVTAVIADVQDQSRADPVVREWLSTLKAAEDVLIEMNYDAIRKVVETEIWSQERSRTSLFVPEPSLIRDATGSLFDGKKLKRVLEKIEGIIGEMNLFGFSIRDTQQQVNAVNWPRSCSYGVESKVIGRSDDLKEIVTSVLGQAERKSVAVLPIVGTGGLGKTTLAQLVYNNAKVQNHFELEVSLCVSDEFDVLRLAKSITDLAIGKECQLPMENVELIQHRLRQVLIGKRYLLVLDNVLNENTDKWEQLKHLLECGSTGSVIIVTTRSQRVASVVGTMSAYDLQGLNEDDLWSIFKQKAFGMGVDEWPEFVDIGKQLIKKCCGSPLAAKVLGGLMSNKKEEREWLIVLESNIWDHVVGENEIIPVLKLGYLNLPSYMKRCFVFCAIFPKDYVIERDTLIRLWIANSYIPIESNMEMEDKGIEIFDELAWRGFFEDVNKDKFTCKMHDLVHDLAQSLVDNEVATLSNLEQQSKLQNNILHLFSFCNRTDGIGSLFQRFSFISTILLSGSAYRSQAKCALDFPKANSFRALSFHYIAIENVCATLGTLKHLMYLDFSWCPISALLESMCTLYNLQTLKLNNCWLLRNLPVDMRYMRSLRHLYLDGCHQLERMPTGLGELRCLQTLTMYIVDPRIGCAIGELKDLNLGGRLELYDLSKLGNLEDARQANLVSKRKLIQLYLSWGSVQSDIIESDDSDVVESNPDTAKDILQGLEPNEELQVLEIRHYNGTLFSAWMHDSRVLRNLTELILVECTRCEALPPICQIPSLKKLTLIRLYSLKHVCTEGLAPEGDVALRMFPKLENLSLVDMPSLESWLENDPAKEELKSLVLSQLALESSELSDMPSIEVSPNIDPERLTSLDFPQLLELTILCCPELDALPSCPFLRVLEIAGETNIPSCVIESFENKGVLVK